MNSNDLTYLTDEAMVTELRRRGWTVELAVNGRSIELDLTPDSPATVVEFDEFWEAYPRKVAKAAAVKAWSKLTLQQRAAALQVIDLHTQMWFAEGRGLRTVPHASTWLNGERWDDEVAFVPERDPNSKAARSKAAIQRAVATHEPKALWS